MWPLVHNGCVYYGPADGFVSAPTAEGGQLLWKFETEDRVLGAPNLFQPSGGGTKPALIVGSYDFRLYSLDLDSGKSNWHYETSNYINGSPAVSSGRTAFGGCDAVLHVIQLAEGKKEKQIDAEAYIGLLYTYDAGDDPLRDDHVVYRDLYKIQSSTHYKIAYATT